MDQRQSVFVHDESDDADSDDDASEARSSGSPNPNDVEIIDPSTATRIRAWGKLRSASRVLALVNAPRRNASSSADSSVPADSTSPRTRRSAVSSAAGSTLARNPMHSLRIALARTPENRDPETCVIAVRAVAPSLIENLEDEAAQNFANQIELLQVLRHAMMGRCAYSSTNLGTATLKTLLRAEVFTRAGDL